ncbi:MAG: hypothetical protein SV253_09080 [Halobacteria archaeon]|nr:hypothetical protein [Halobacteria archaeon]
MFVLTHSVVFLAALAWSYVVLRRKINEVLGGLSASILWIVVLYGSTNIVSPVSCSSCSSNYVLVPHSSEMLVYVSLAFSVLMFIYAFWAALGESERFEGIGGLGSIDSFRERRG